MECNTNTHDVYGDLAICTHLWEIQFTPTWRMEIPRAARTLASSLCKSLLLHTSRFCGINSPPSHMVQLFFSRSTPPLTNPSLTKSLVRVSKLKSKSESNGTPTQSLGMQLVTFSVSRNQAKPDSDCFQAVSFVSESQNTRQTLIYSHFQCPGLCTWFRYVSDIVLSL